MKDRHLEIEGKQVKVMTGEIIAQDGKCPLGRRLPRDDVSLLGTPSNGSTGSIIWLAHSDALCKLRKIQCMLNGGNASVD